MRKIVISELKNVRSLMEQVLQWFLLLLQGYYTDIQD